MRHDFAHSMATHPLFGRSDESTRYPQETRGLLNEIDALRRAALPHLVGDAKDFPPLADLPLIECNNNKPSGKCRADPLRRRADIRPTSRT